MKSYKKSIEDYITAGYVKLKDIVIQMMMPGKLPSNSNSRKKGSINLQSDLLQFTQWKTELSMPCPYSCALIQCSAAVFKLGWK